MFKKKPLELDPRTLKRLFKQKNEVQVMVYWEDHYEELRELILQEDQEDVALDALHLLASSLNKREKYTWTEYIYKKIYRPKAWPKTPEGPLAHNLKYELAKGLHFSRSYSESKGLFDELKKVESFDHSRFEDWYEHTAASRLRENEMSSDSFLLVLTQILLFVFLVIAFLANWELQKVTMVYLILSTAVQCFLYKERVASFFGNWKKHKKAVKALRLYLAVELTVALVLLVVCYFGKYAPFEILLVVLSVQLLLRLTFKFFALNLIVQKGLATTF